MANLFQNETTSQSKEPVRKLKSERIEEWQAVAKKMFTWFDQLNELPKEPVQITYFSKILHVKKFIETQRATIEANFNDPFSRGFNASYMRLFTLKKYIEKNNVELLRK